MRQRWCVWHGPPPIVCSCRLLQSVSAVVRAHSVVFPHLCLYVWGAPLDFVGVTHGDKAVSHAVAYAGRQWG